MKKITISAALAAAAILLCSCSEVKAAPAGGTLEAPAVSSGSGNNAAEQEAVVIIGGEEAVIVTKEASGEDAVFAGGEPEGSAENTRMTAPIPPDKAVKEITLTFYEKDLKIGESCMPIVAMFPEDTPDKSELWSSSDEKIAQVDGIGRITGISEGRCTITVRSAASPGISASVTVTVRAASEGLTYIDGILIANKTYSLPADYAPGVDPDAQAAFDKMSSAAAAEGLNMYISSGFRSYEYQSGLYERYVSRSGKAEADRYSARPGHSEHQTGLAFDLNTIDISFADTKEYEWLKKNCAGYGFIIRYPEDGESKTGYMYEPWHIRYLGVETAKKVSDSGLTLEEYLGITSVYSE